MGPLLKYSLMRKYLQYVLLINWPLTNSTFDVKTHSGPNIQPRTLFWFCVLWLPVGEKFPSLLFFYNFGKNVNADTYYKKSWRLSVFVPRVVLLVTQSRKFCKLCIFLTSGLLVHLHLRSKPLTMCSVL